MILQLSRAMKSSLYDELWSREVEVSFQLERFVLPLKRFPTLASFSFLEIVGSLLDLFWAPRVSDLWLKTLNSSLLLPICVAILFMAALRILVGKDFFFFCEPCSGWHDPRKPKFNSLLLISGRSFLTCVFRCGAEAKVISVTVFSCAYTFDLHLYLWLTFF